MINMTLMWIWLSDNKNTSWWKYLKNKIIWWGWCSNENSKGFFSRSSFDVGNPFVLVSQWPLLNLFLFPVTLWIRTSALYYYADVSLWQIWWRLFLSVSVAEAAMLGYVGSLDSLQLVANPNMQIVRF